MKKLLSDVKKSLFKLIFNNCLIYSQPKSNAIALTFDDGPHPENTERLLAILKREGVKATFFFTGELVQNLQVLVLKVADDGHELGNHAFYHKSIKVAGFSNYMQGIKKTDEMLPYKKNGHYRLFRPPYGELNLKLLLYALKKRIKIVLWSFDSLDSFKRTPEELRAHINPSFIKNGDILLFHEDYNHTVKALPGIIAELKSKGYKFSTVSEMINRGS